MNDYTNNTSGKLVCFNSNIGRYLPEPPKTSCGFLSDHHKRKDEMRIEFGWPKMRTTAL